MSDAASRFVLDADARFNVPKCVYWNTEQMREWMVEIGYPQYQECITRNHVNGRHLIGLDATKLPDMGITDFEHIKDITAKVRQLIGLNHIIKNINVSMSDPLIAYLDMKRRTGKTSYNTSYQAFINKYRRWYR